MTQFTIVTDPHGNFVAAVQGHSLATNQDGIKAQVSFPKGHQLHNVQVDDALAKTTDPAAFYQGILKFVPKR